jgi:RNA polymerase-binding transcription factor DksA
MIEAALDRIASGSYGTCASCGDPIGEARLDVLPYTPVCADCAAGRS